VKRAFTLLEMLISVLLTAILFTYLYSVLNGVRDSHRRYEASAKSVTLAQTIFSQLTQDITQLRSPLSIIHEAGYDRFSLTTDHSIYGIARPWVHYYISQKDHALIRIEATAPIDFFHSNYIGDQNGSYFFADKLAEECTSLRISNHQAHVDLMVQCKTITPIVMRLYKGDQ
jgi:prepilin-type N-terminal cleavage/methylation domain-containing protein